MSQQKTKRPWHTMENREVQEQLGSSLSGLGATEAAGRLEKYGRNELSAGEGTSAIRMMLHQFEDALIWLLIGAAVVSFVGGHRVDAYVIVGVLVLNAILGFVQEFRAEGALAALRQMSAPQATVIRDGQIETVPAAELVPGDLIQLESGDVVPADARLLDIEEMAIDESALTGESQPAGKTVEPVGENALLADRKNMVFMSTAVTDGRGRAIVTATGMDTEIGQVAEQVRSAEREATPLQKRMTKLGKILGIGGIALAGLVFGLGVLRSDFSGGAIFEMLMFSVAVAVSAIPEGLPAVISVTLALGVQRMAGHNAIIRRLPAVETLGSTTVICSDKTGTITKNQMTVTGLWAEGKHWQVTGEGYAPDGEVRSGDGGPGELPDSIRLLLQIGVLDSNAHLQQEGGRWHVIGDPTEGALLTAAAKAGIDRDQLEQDNPRLDEIPFSSVTKYMATLHGRADRAPRLLVKGGFDAILPYCTHALIDGQRQELTDAYREQIRQANEDLSSRALRVLAGGVKDIESGRDHVDDADVQEGLTFVGLWGMMDPPRESSARAVAAARRAGIRPIMLTGDHASTALAIARAVGMTESDKALTGAEAEEMDPDALADAALEVGVFARVSPSHKLKILSALKDRGHIVAMTGDGVNDAPALKGADIGVAMGVTGTEVAKEAADMVLTDDNFATIVQAVQEGRSIYNNLRRVVYFLLATNLGEILTLLGALIVGLPLPLTAIMILWVNLVTDGACTVPLGVEPQHGDVLGVPPRDPKASLLDKVALRRMAILTPLMAIGTLLLFWLELEYGGTEQHAITIAFATMSAFQWFQALNARSRHDSIFKVGLLSNRWLLVGLGAAIVLQILAVQTPIGHAIFKTVPLTWFDWLLVVAVSGSILVADEILKLLGVHGKVRQDQQKE